MHQKALSLLKEYTIKENEEHKTQSTGLRLQPCRCECILLFFFILIFIYLFICFLLFLVLWLSNDNSSGGKHTERK